MNIGTVIRTYRKEKNMTQEEMANRLGVTAPAVNKWEKGNSYPDITLLAPIARLLNISLDTLLSFQEELTEEEITQIIMEADQRLKTESYEEVFQWAKQKIETYPNSLMLIWQLAISHLSCLAIEDENYKKAHKLADIQSGLERLFERGKYYETSCKLDVATAEKDTDMLLDIMEEMLENVDTISGFCDSDLFEHMEFRKADSDFQKEMKQNLIRCFQDEETYGFLAGNEWWERIREGSVAVTV